LLNIVGHGPSLLGRGLGEEIDREPTVRLKRCQHLLGDPDYGSRIDYVCGSWTIRNGLPEAKKWVFLDSRHENVTESECLSFDGVVFQPLCRRWNAYFRELRGPYTRHPKTVPSHSDDMGHRHMSAGLHAILYACELGFKEIRLWGFDNVLSGEFTWSVTRGPQWNEYPDHRWDVERRLLELIKSDYGADIESCHLLTEPV